MTITDTTPPQADRPQAPVKQSALKRNFARAYALLPEKWRRRTPVVAVLPLAGAIGAASRFGGGLSMSRLEKVIDNAFTVKGAKAVALVINSPGGSPAQSHLIMRRIRALAEEKKLPVYAFVEDVAASGGYMIACAADEILADPASILGSIGVVSASFGFDKLIDKIGVERRVHTAGRSKTLLDPFRPEKPEDVERLSALQRDIHDMFIALVKERRAGKLKGDDDTLFTGEFWLAPRAIELGLADGIGDVRSAMRRRFGEKVRFKTITEPRGFLSRRLGFGTSFSAVESEQLTEGIIAALEGRAIRARFGL
ncbi:peptidase S49 [Labrys miyagiensis]|uniref:Peptidase S49 n=1 Tax=Labrys miyagiensis TaxID=346912 RepID=A0ABQ6CWA6_9HYPH|nr:peptidase S49 [Labrys miyagiensis]